MIRDSEFRPLFKEVLQKERIDSSHHMLDWSVGKREGQKTIGEP